ncbi:hypothetical protein LMTR3_12655 [Bradyrhizobium sp. LMTR 3]|nr:hypothetical protein LMTR3_12655 [Bradyrhizobium sp. LMTR 3]
MDTTSAPLASVGIDIGKEVFHVVGFGTDGKIAFRRKIKRLALVETFRRLPPKRGRHGGVPQRPLCQPGAAPTGAPAAHFSDRGPRSFEFIHSLN